MRLERWVHKCFRDSIREVTFEFQNLVAGRAQLKRMEITLAILSRKGLCVCVCVCV